MSEMAKGDKLDGMVEGAMLRSFGPPHSAAARAESIEPSSGFAASVMERVRAEAARDAALGPIRFPWLRAVPGICMAVLAIIVCVTLFVFAAIGVTHMLSSALLSATVQTGHGALPAWADLLNRLHLGWMLLALAVVFVPLMLSRSLLSRDHRV